MVHQEALHGVSLFRVTVQEVGLLQKNVTFCAIMKLIMKLLIANNLLTRLLWILAQVYSPTCLEVNGQRHASAALLTGKRRIHIVREAGWLPWPFGRLRKILPTPWIDLRTLQRVASRKISHCCHAIVVNDTQSCHKNWRISRSCVC
jgi:hypothetical protein